METKTTKTTGAYFFNGKQFVTLYSADRARQQVDGEYRARRHHEARCVARKSAPNWK